MNAALKYITNETNRELLGIRNDWLFPNPGTFMVPAIHWRVTINIQCTNNFNQFDWDSESKRPKAPFNTKKSRNATKRNNTNYVEGLFWGPN